MANRLIEKLGRPIGGYLSKHGGVDELIEYLEKDEWKFGSGYAKAYIIRMLGKIDLKYTQAERLRRVVLAVVEGRDRREFRHYCRLVSPSRKGKYDNRELSMGSRVWAFGNIT